MTTTIEKILAKAAELDQQAAALRLAASLLNGDATHRKQATAAQTVQQAITIRQAQRPAGKKPKKQSRAVPILAALTTTPQTRQELHARVPQLTPNAISTALNTLLHRKQVKKTAEGWARA